MDEPTLDSEALARLHRIGGSEFVAEMIALFLENAPKRLTAARDALGDDDWTTLHRVVHSLKSTAATLGARGLESVARTTEERAKDEEPAEIPALLELLEREYAVAREQLEAERDRLVDG